MLFLEAVQQAIKADAEPLICLLGVILLFALLLNMLEGD